MLTETAALGGLHRDGSVLMIRVAWASPYADMRHPPTALAIIGGIKAAFIKHAREDLGLTEPEE